MRRIIGAVLTVAVLAGCESGQVKVEWLEAQLEKKEQRLEDAERLLTALEGTVEEIKVSGIADASTIARLEGQLYTAQLTVITLEESTEQLERDIEEARAAGESTLPWDKVLTGALSTAVALLTGVPLAVSRTNKLRDQRRRDRDEKV